MGAHFSFFVCVRWISAREIFPVRLWKGVLGGGRVPPALWVAATASFFIWKYPFTGSGGKGGAQARPEAGSFRPPGSISTPTNAADTRPPFAFVTEIFPALFTRTISLKIHMQSPCFYTHYTTLPEEENPLRLFSPGVFEKLIPTTEANIE